MSRTLVLIDTQMDFLPFEDGKVLSEGVIKQDMIRLEQFLIASDVDPSGFFPSEHHPLVIIEEEHSPFSRLSLASEPGPVVLVIPHVPDSKMELVSLRQEGNFYETHRQPQVRPPRKKR